MLRALLLFAVTALAGCGEVWNDPYPASERTSNTLYSAFVERPKHLDPVQSYTEDEARFTQQVYEPPLQYHYLKRPYQLVPLTASEVPKAREVDGGNGHSGKRSTELHFGLGAHSPDIPLDVELFWRDGQGRVERRSLSVTPGWHTVSLGR